MSPSIASSIANRFKNDGQNFLDKDGNRLEEVCTYGGSKRLEDLRQSGKVRYEFGDGSAIVISTGGWDLAADKCLKGFCWKGQKCTCLRNQQLMAAALIEKAKGGDIEILHGDWNGIPTEVLVLADHDRAGLAAGNHPVWGVWDKENQVIHLDGSGVVIDINGKMEGEEN